MIEHTSTSSLRTSVMYTAWCCAKYFWYLPHAIIPVEDSKHLILRTKTAQYISFTKSDFRLWWSSGELGLCNIICGAPGLMLLFQYQDHPRSPLIAFAYVFTEPPGHSRVRSRRKGRKSSAHDLLSSQNYVSCTQSPTVPRTVIYLDLLFSIIHYDV